jgi:heme exporter protein D
MIDWALLQVPSLPGPPPTSGGFPAWVWWGGGIVVFGVLGLLYLQVSDAKTLLAQTEERLQKQIAEVREDLDQMTTEHTALIGINITELLKFAEKGYQQELKGLREELEVADKECRRLERLVNTKEGAR